MSTIAGDFLENSCPGNAMPIWPVQPTKWDDTSWSSSTQSHPEQLPWNSFWHPACMQPPVNFLISIWFPQGVVQSLCSIRRFKAKEVCWWSIGAFGCIELLMMTCGPRSSVSLLSCSLSNRSSWIKMCCLNHILAKICLDLLHPGLEVLLKSLKAAFCCKES